MAVATVVGSKLTWFHLGDCSIQLYRYLPCLQTYSLLFKTDTHHVAFQGSGGETLEAPKQLAIYSQAERNQHNIGLLIGQSSYGIIKDIQVQDVLIVCSDGIVDNVDTHTICTVLNERYPLDSSAVVETILGLACRAGAPKPDDLALFVGELVPM